MESGPPSGGKYMYAIADANGARWPSVTGIDGRPVGVITQGKVTAVVSDCSHARLRPERAHLLAHREVLRRLMEDRTVLPVAFGIIADDPKAVRRMLSVNQAAFVEQLERVAGKLEMGLRITWDVPNIFDYFVDTHPVLRVARDRLIANQRQARQEDKVELGRLFDRILADARDAVATAVEGVLAPSCVEIKRSAPRGLKEAVNLSLLVERGAQSRLEEAVCQAAAHYDNNYTFDLHGPWAPHDFVELNLQAGA